MTVRTVLHNGLLCVLAIVVTIGLLEISVRAYQSLRWSTSFWGTFGGPDQTDEILGWRPKPFHSFDMDTVDHSGTPYNVQYRSYEHGFREWQDDRDKALRILFIGDSYTRAKSVSNDKTYYNIVAQNHPIEVFAFGDSGYGTLQEYMILDQCFWRNQS
jgi:hypothetical protein